MPNVDLVNDPKYFGVHTTGEENPLHDDDPSNDWRFDSWQNERNLWREWHGKQEEAKANLVRDAAAEGLTGDEALTRAGFENRKEAGKHAFTMYGNNGYYARMGAAADPGWEYDWASGRKFNKGTADKYANGTLGTRWESINRTEREEFNKAQKYMQQGLTDYGQQANAELFNRQKGGHFNLDPRTGLWYSGAGANDPNNVWVDQFGRRAGSKTASAPKGSLGNAAASNTSNWSSGLMGSKNTGITGGSTYRPFLNTDPKNSNYGAWGSTMGKPQARGAQQKSTLTGESDQYAGPNKTTVPGLGGSLYSQVR